MTDTGWDVAEFTCGRCFTTVTATTEREYVALIGQHKATCGVSRPVPCGSTPDNPRCTVSKHAICEKHH